MAYVAQSFLQRRTAQIMATHGEAMTLKRVGQADLPVQGKRLMKSRSGGAGEYSNSASPTELYVRIENVEILASTAPTQYPVIGDFIYFGGRNYEINHVDTRADSGAVLAHFLFVEGGVG